MSGAIVAHQSTVFCGAIQVALQGLKFDTGTAMDANAMLDLLVKRRSGLIVIDANLPPFGGKEAIRSVKGFHNVCPKIIAILPDSDFESARALRSVGADEVILDGYSFEKLRIKVGVVGLLQR